MTIREFQGVRPKIDDTAYIDDSAVIIGNVTIAEHASIWPMVVVRGDVNKITIGKYTNIQDGSILHVTHDGKYTPGGFDCTVGDYVTVGHRVTVHACTVGDNCLLGMSSTIMDGAIIEDNVILGAGGLVPNGKVLESGYLYVGSPVKRVRKLKEAEIEALRYSAEHYSSLKDQHKS